MWKGIAEWRKRGSREAANASGEASLPAVYWKGVRSWGRKWPVGMGAGEERCGDARGSSSGQSDVFSPLRGAGRGSRKGDRADVPVRRPYQRGSKWKAQAIAACESSRRVAVKEMKRNRWAKTSGPAKRCRRRLAEDIAKRAAGEPVYPLRPCALEAVAGVLRAAGYRSGDKYLQELRLRHIENGHAWCDQLKRCMKMCCASMARGLGPRRKAAEVRLQYVCRRVAGADGEELLLAARSFLIAMFWLLREIELAGVKLHRSHVALEGDCATLHLPMSKTDTGGLGRSRSLRCICHVAALADGGVAGAEACAVCALRRQVAWVVAATGTLPDCD